MCSRWKNPFWRKRSALAVIKEEEAEKENGILMKVVGGACGKQTAGSLLHVRMLSSEGSTGGSIVSVPMQCVDCVCMQAVSPTRTKGYIAFKDFLMSGT